MRRQWFSGLVVVSILTLPGCGDAVTPPAIDSQSVGGVPSGAPLGAARSNRAVLLTDATQYRPAQAGPGAAGGDGGGGSAGPAAATGGDADAQVRDAVRDMVSLILDGEALVALRIFNPDEVAALIDGTDPLFATLEQLDALRRSVAEKLGDAEAARLDRVARGLEPAPNHRVLDAQNASVEPVPIMILIGPERTPGSARLTLMDGRWRLQLDRTLTAQDVEAIHSYHAQLGDRLARIHDWVLDNAQIDAAVLENALRAALRGEDFDLAGATPAVPSGMQPPPGTEAPPGVQLPPERPDERQLPGGVVAPELP